MPQSPYCPLPVSFAAVVDIGGAKNDTASLSGDGDCSTGGGGIRAGDGDDRSIDGCDRSIDTAKRTTAPRHPFRISFEG